MTCGDSAGDSAGEERRGLHQRLPQAVGQGDRPRAARRGRSAAGSSWPGRSVRACRCSCRCSSGAPRSRSEMRSSLAACASSSKCGVRDGPDQQVGDEADGEHADHGEQRRVGSRPRSGCPARPAASRNPLTISGPATPAADHAVSSRPWMAPTWSVPNRSLQVGRDGREAAAVEGDDHAGEQHEQRGRRCADERQQRGRAPARRRGRSCRSACGRSRRKSTTRRTGRPCCTATAGRRSRPPPRRDDRGSPSRGRSPGSSARPARGCRCRRSRCRTARPTGARTAASGSRWRRARASPLVTSGLLLDRAGQPSASSPRRAPGSAQAPIIMNDEVDDAEREERAAPAAAPLATASCRSGRSRSRRRSAAGRRAGAAISAPPPKPMIARPVARPGPVGEPLDQRRDRRDVADAEADAADHAVAEVDAATAGRSRCRARRPGSRCAQQQAATNIALRGPTALDPGAAAPRRTGRASRSRSRRSTPIAVRLVSKCVDQRVLEDAEYA